MVRRFNWISSCFCNHNFFSHLSANDDLQLPTMWTASCFSTVYREPHCSTNTPSWQVGRTNRAKSKTKENKPTEVETAEESITAADLQPVLLHFWFRGQGTGLNKVKESWKPMLIEFNAKSKSKMLSRIKASFSTIRNVKQPIRRPRQEGQKLANLTKKWANRFAGMYRNRSHPIYGLKWVVLPLCGPCKNSLFNFNSRMVIKVYQQTNRHMVAEKRCYVSDDILAVVVVAVT